MLELQLLMQQLKSQPTHKLLAKQLVRAAGANGEVDLQKLAESVSAAYEELDRDRRRTDRSIELMIAEVEASQKRLLDALDIVPEGFVLFDADDRYVLWNKRYVEMYPENRDLIAVGKRFEDVLREGLARGQHPGVVGKEKEEEWVAQRLALHALPQSTHEQQLPDGRWLRVEERRTADGGSIGVRVDITDLKRREASFRLLFDGNPIPMWLYEHGSLRFLAVNDAAVAHYGYSRNQFLTMTLLEIRPSQDREKLRRDLETPAGDLPQGRVRRHIKADGTQIDVSIYAQELQYEGRNARLAAAINITAQKQAEKELLRAREFLNTVIDNVPATIVVKDLQEFRYVLINRAGEEFFGRPRDQIIGKTAYEIFSKSEADTIMDWDRRLIEQGGQSFFDERPIDTPGKGNRLITTRRVIVRSPDSEPLYLLGIIEDVTERRQAEARIAHMAQHDALTDLPNRTAFNENFEATLKRSAAANESFALMSIDLNRFKEINDVFSHSIGDAMLCEISRRLQAVAGNAFIARLAGDEFIVIATNGSQPESAAALAEELLGVMTEEFEIKGQHLRASLSIGVAFYPNDGIDGATLLGNADAALYRAKADGRGTVRFFQADMDKRLREQRALHHDLSTALERRELVLHFQPQATIEGDVIGLEALVRWDHPIRGLVPPAMFIPIAEETGLIMPIGEWVLREACREAASWLNPLQIAVNLSPVQFRHGDLPALIHSILLETGLQPDRLELEITESVLIDNFSKGTSILRRLKSLGVRIAMDDFGTGYSSLSYLQSFPFDKIKIDQAFISNVERNAQSATIVRAVIGLAKGLGLPVLAEGVETEEQLAFLTREACNQVQGYLIGRPYPIDRYLELIGRPAAAKQKALVA